MRNSRQSCVYSAVFSRSPQKARRVYPVILDPTPLERNVTVTIILEPCRIKTKGTHEGPREITCFLV